MAPTPIPTPPRMAMPALVAATDLPERPRTWIHNVGLLIAGGLIGAGLAYLKLGLLPSVLVAGVAAGLGLIAAVKGRRRHQQRLLGDRVADLLAPLIGWRSPDPSLSRLVRLRRWSRDPQPYPQVIELRYAKTAPFTDPLWIPAITEAVAKLLPVTYSPAPNGHDSLRRRLVLVPAVITADTPAHPLEQRACDLVTQLMGESAQVCDVNLEDDKLRGFTVRHEIAYRASLTGFRRRIEQQLLPSFGGRWRSNWNLINDTVRFDVRPKLETKIPNPGAPVTAENRRKIPFGQDEDGNAVVFDLDLSPHMMVAGKTRTGKTISIYSIITGCAATGREFQVWAGDPKQVELMGFPDWPNVQIVTTETIDIIAMILHARTEMERRYRLIKTRQVKSHREFPTLIVVLDEVAELMGNIKDWWSVNKPKTKGTPTQCPAITWFYSLAQMAAKADIHLVVGMQRPDVAILSGAGAGAARDNFAARASYGRLSPSGAQMMWEDNWVAAVTVPSRIQGRGTGSSPSDPDTPVEIQGYWTPDPETAESAEDLQILERLRPASSTHPDLRIEYDPELMFPIDDEGDPTGEENLWDAVLASKLIEVTAPAAGVSSASIEPPIPSQRSIAHVTTSDAEFLSADRDASVDTDFPPADEGELEGYGELELLSAEDVQPGDLVLVDEDAEIWAPAEMVEGDFSEEGNVLIDFRDELGNPESLSCPAAGPLAVRRFQHSANADGD